ncbi:MAG: tetratricopeptide repeat protein [Aquisalinus sp.]|nr:tetratricopeptide repeat protein [Aquisalinus sp.]
MAEDLTFQTAVQLHGQGNLTRARTLYEELLRREERIADCATNLSVIHLVSQSLKEAERYARLALEHAPNNANAWNNLGLALKHQNRWQEARDAFIRSVQADDQHERAWSNLAEAFDKTGDPEKGLGAAATAVRIDPDWGAAQVQYIYRKLGAASWDGLDTNIQKISRLLRAGSTEIDPFLLLFICNDPAEIQLAARAKSKLITTAAQKEATGTESKPAASVKPQDKIRLGYVSANFNTHAVAAHVLEVIENHDPEQFEVFCYCHTAAPADHVQDRLRAAGVTFRRINNVSNLSAANQIREDQVEILVDLMGYTEGARLQIFAHRPASVSITWIGFAGSIGANWMDYILADDIVLPAEHEAFYEEKVIRLSCSYQSNDSTRLIHPVSPKRSDYGLPEQGQILCCFNKPAKINPAVVSLWVKIMNAVPNSVLWLWGLTPMATQNLRKAFIANGIESPRIIMAESEPFPIHLARHALCDLFLDTFPYSGHATTSNALYGGCPVLTLQGSTFAARVSASLLKDLDMDELIADTPETYVRKAINLLQDPLKLAALKNKLQMARTSNALFQGKSFARRFDKALQEIAKRHRQGLPPANIRV